MTSTSIPAGDFTTWLTQACAALRSNVGMQVPCGDCVGCCTSHYSILLRPHDVALDIVPAALQSSVPGLSYPFACMKPRADGTCPMFNQGRCDIYTQRPQTCLDYDCRVFAASGLLAGEDRPVINQRVRAWVFEYADDGARAAHQAIQAAATYLQQHADEFPMGWLPRNPSGMAVLAIKAHTLFLHTPNPTPESVVEECRAFDASSSAASL